MPSASKVVIYFFGVLAVAYGCSEPIGGYKEPTPAQIVYYAHHVVVGEVTNIEQPDPMYGDMYGTTYGAMVNVNCTYKGGPLPARIMIGGAGFVPGHCYAMNLEKGKTYIIFLHESQNDVYEQSDTAVPTSNLMEYLKVCNLDRQYPVDNGVMMKREGCPPASKLDSCQRFNVEQSSTPISIEKGTVKPRRGDTNAQDSSTEGRSSNVKSDPGSGSAALVTSFFTILLALFATRI